MANVKVAVRARPLNKREIENGAKIIVDINGETVNVTNLKVPENQECDSRERVRQFVYDYCYSSAESGSSRYASQEMIFQDLGTDVLEAVFEGYNACVLAYGQSGSGKTYTMMGHPEEMGLTPRICESLFSRIDDVTEDRISVRTDVSFIEIYNERVRDLLRSPLSRKHRYTLRVREHPKLGPYVQDLSRHMVTDFQNVQELIERGNENRSVAATQMHQHSSRSHAIFTINFTQARLDADLPSEVLSKIHLVDLAGSERASTEFNKVRLKEGANINKSLVTLGNVISALAEKSLSTWSLDSLGSSYSMSSSTGESVATSPQSSPRRSRQSFVPYRDSVLTWLLKDTLGGNSKTIMIATVSPASTSYSDTVSTLRYAQRAKCIVNRPMINEDPNVKLIRELRAEISRLRSILSTAQSNCSIPSALDGISISEILNQNENKAIALTKSWIEKWHESQNIVEDSEMSIRKSSSGVIVDSPLPHLVALNNDILSTGIQIYYLKEGSTVIGNDDPSSIADIVVSGSDIYGEHCQLYFDEGNVTLIPVNGAMCMVNDEIVLGPIQLRQADILKLGTQNLFRFNNPIEALKLKKFREGMLLNRWNKMALTFCPFHQGSIHSTEVFHQNNSDKMLIESSAITHTGFCRNCEHLKNNCINIINAKLDSPNCDSGACLCMRRLSNSRTSFQSPVNCNQHITLQKQITENSETSALKDAAFCKCNGFAGCHVHSTPSWSCSSYCNCINSCVHHSSPIQNSSLAERSTSDCCLESSVQTVTVKQECTCECLVKNNLEEEQQSNIEPEQILDEVQENAENLFNTEKPNSQLMTNEPSFFRNGRINLEDSNCLLSKDTKNVSRNIQTDMKACHENPESSIVDSYCSCESNLHLNIPNGSDCISSDTYMSCEIQSFSEPVNSSIILSGGLQYECELHSLHKDCKYLTEDKTNCDLHASEKQTSLFKLRRSWSSPVLHSVDFNNANKDSSHFSSRSIAFSSLKNFQSCPDLSPVKSSEFTLSHKNNCKNTLQLHHYCPKKSGIMYPLETPENSLRKQVIHKNRADFNQSHNVSGCSSCPGMAHSLFSDSAIDVCEETSNVSFRPLLPEWMETNAKINDNSTSSGTGLLEESEISEDNTQSSGFNSDLIVEVKNFVNVARDITDSEQLLKVFQNSLQFNNDNHSVTEEIVISCPEKDSNSEITSEDSKLNANDVPSQLQPVNHLAEICDDDPLQVQSDNEIIVVLETSPTAVEIRPKEENSCNDSLSDKNELTNDVKSVECPQISINFCEFDSNEQKSEENNLRETQLYNEINIPIPQINHEIFYSESNGNDNTIKLQTQSAAENVDFVVQEEEISNIDMQFAVYDDNLLKLNDFTPFGSNLLSVGESDLKRSLSNLDIQQALLNECESHHAVETDQSFCPPVSPALAIKIRNNSWPEPSQHSLDQLDSEIKDLQEGIDENLFDEVLLNIGFEDAENGICEILYVNENQQDSISTEKEQLQTENLVTVEEMDIKNRLETENISENQSINNHSLPPKNLSDEAKISSDPFYDQLQSQETCSLPAVAATAVVSSRVMRKLVRQRAKQRLSRDTELVSPSEDCGSFSDDSLSEEKPNKFQNKKKKSKLNVVVYKDGYEESDYSLSDDDENVNQCDGNALENNLNAIAEDSSLEVNSKKRLRRINNVVSSSLSSIESACDNANDNEAVQSVTYEELVKDNEHCIGQMHQDITSDKNTDDSLTEKDKELGTVKENNASLELADETNSCISKTITFAQELTVVEEEAKNSSVPLIVLTRPSLSSCFDSFEDEQTPLENVDYDFDNIFANNTEYLKGKQFIEYAKIGQPNRSNPIDIPSDSEIRGINQLTFDQLPDKFAVGNEIAPIQRFDTDDMEFDSSEFNSWQSDENFSDFVTCKDFDRSQLKLDIDCAASSDNVSPQSSSTTTSSSEPSHEDYYIDNNFSVLSPMDILIDYRLISPTGRRILYTIQEMSSECSSTPSESNLACSLEDSLDTAELNNTITEKFEINRTDQLLSNSEDQTVVFNDGGEKNPFSFCPTIGSNESTKEIIDHKINTVSPVSHGSSLLSSTEDFKSRSSNDSREQLEQTAKIENSESNCQSEPYFNEMSSNLHVSNLSIGNSVSGKDKECKNELPAGDIEAAKHVDSSGAAVDRCCSTSPHFGDSHLTGGSSTTVNGVKLTQNTVQQNANLQDSKLVESKELMSPIERVACQDLWKLREKFSQESDEETEEEGDTATSQPLESQQQNRSATEDTVLNEHHSTTISLLENKVNDIENLEISLKEIPLKLEEIRTVEKDGEHIKQDSVILNNGNSSSMLKNLIPTQLNNSNSVNQSLIDPDILFEFQGNDQLTTEVHGKIENNSSDDIDIDTSNKKGDVDSVMKVSQLTELDSLIKSEETVHQSEMYNLIDLDSSYLNCDEVNMKENPDLVELIENIDIEEIISENDLKFDENLFNVTEDKSVSNISESSSEFPEVVKDNASVVVTANLFTYNYLSRSLSEESNSASDYFCDLKNNVSDELQEHLSLESPVSDQNLGSVKNNYASKSLINEDSSLVSENSASKTLSNHIKNISIDNCSKISLNESNLCDVINTSVIENDSNINDSDSFKSLELKLFESEVDDSSLSSKQSSTVNAISINSCSETLTNTSQTCRNSEVKINNDELDETDNLNQRELFEQHVPDILNKLPVTKLSNESVAKVLEIELESRDTPVTQLIPISAEDKKNQIKSDLEIIVVPEKTLQNKENIHWKSNNPSNNTTEYENSKICNHKTEATSEFLKNNEVSEEEKLCGFKEMKDDCTLYDSLLDTPSLLDSIDEKDTFLANCSNKSEYSELVDVNATSKNETALEIEMQPPECKVNCSPSLVDCELNSCNSTQTETTHIIPLNTSSLLQNEIEDTNELVDCGTDAVQEEMAEDTSFDDIIFTLPKSLADLKYEETTNEEEPYQSSEDLMPTLWNMEFHSNALGDSVYQEYLNELERNKNNSSPVSFTKDANLTINEGIEMKESNIHLSNDIYSTNKSNSFSFYSNDTFSPEDDYLSEEPDSMNNICKENNAFLDEIGSSDNIKLNSESKDLSVSLRTKNEIAKDDLDDDADWISKINDAFNINLVLLDNEDSNNETNDAIFSDQEHKNKQISNGIQDTEILKTLSGLSIDEISNEDSQSFAKQIPAEKYLYSNSGFSEVNVCLKENSKSMKLRTEDFYNICSSSETTHDRTITPDSLEVLCKDEHSSKNVTNFTSWKSRQNTNHHFTVRSTPVETSTDYSNEITEPCPVIMPDLWDRSWETSSDSITFVFVGPGENFHFDSNSDILLPANFSLHKDCSGKCKDSTNLKFCRHLHPQCSLLARSVSLENINLPQHFSMFQCNLATRASSMESMIPSDLMDVVEKGRLHDIDLDEMSGNQSSGSSFCADSINTVVKCDTDLLNDKEFMNKSSRNENFRDFHCRQKKSVSWSDLSGLALEQGPTSKNNRPVFLKPIIKKSENLQNNIFEMSSVSTTPLTDNIEAFKSFESKLSTPEDELERSALFQKIKRHHTGFFTSSKPTMSLNLPDSIKARMKRSCSEADISVEDLTTFESEPSTVPVDNSASKITPLTLSLPNHIKARLLKDNQEISNSVDSKANSEIKSNSSELFSEDEDDTLEVVDNISLESHLQDLSAEAFEKHCSADSTEENNSSNKTENNLCSVQTRLSQSLGTLMNKDMILADWARLSSVMLEASNFFQQLSVYCAGKISEKPSIYNVKDEFSIVNFLDSIRPQSEELSSLIQSKIVPEPITLKDVGIQCEAIEFLSKEVSTQTPTELFEKNKAETGTSTDFLVNLNEKECQATVEQVDSCTNTDLESSSFSNMIDISLSSLNSDSIDEDDSAIKSLFPETDTLTQNIIYNTPKHLSGRKLCDLQSELETTKTKKNYLNCSQIFVNSHQNTDTDLVKKAANSKISKEITTKSSTDNYKKSDSNELHLIGGDIKLAIDSSTQVNTLHLQNHRLESTQNMREACLRKEHEILTSERNHVLKLLNKYGETPQFKKDLHCNGTDEFLNEDYLLKDTIDCESQNLFYLMEYQARLQDACRRIEIKLEKLTKKRRVAEFVLRNGQLNDDSDSLQPSSSFNNFSQCSLTSHLKSNNSPGYPSNQSVNQRIKPREYRARLVDIRRNLVAACRGSAVLSQGSSNESNKSSESSPVHSNKSGKSKQNKSDDLPSLHKCLSDEETISSGNSIVNNSRKLGKSQNKQCKNSQCSVDNCPEDIRKLLKECQDARERARREIELAQEQLKHQKLAVQNLADVLRKRS